MATVTAKYLGDLRVECTHVASGTKLVSDAPVDNHGKGEAFSPTDLCVTALASCAMRIGPSSPCVMVLTRTFFNAAAVVPPACA